MIYIVAIIAVTYLLSTIIALVAAIVEKSSIKDAVKVDKNPRSMALQIAVITTICPVINTIIAISFMKRLLYSALKF